jgi:hypothetical protein
VLSLGGWWLDGTEVGLVVVRVLRSERCHTNNWQRLSWVPSCLLGWKRRRWLPMSCKRPSGFGEMCGVSFFCPRLTKLGELGS